MEFKDDVKHHTDYSNTIIYKITCKDPTITDLYVGHTINFNQRRSAHMNSCINNKAANHMCKLYKTIRSKGGWSNWSMDILECFNCADQYDARKKEQEYYMSLNATLNSIEPLPIYNQGNRIHESPVVDLESVPTCKDSCINKRFNCTLCKYLTDNKTDYEKHCLTRKHICRQDVNYKLPSTCDYTCEICEYITNNKKDYGRHLVTRKHVLLTQSREKSLDVAVKKNHYECICKKVYRHKTSLCSHKKKCSFRRTNISSGHIEPTNHFVTTHTQRPSILSNDVIYELLKEIVISNQQNTEFKQIMVEQHARLLELSKNDAI